MGRTCKRVPLDFDHPLGEVWPGFILEVRDCPNEDCHYGSTTDEGWLDAILSLLLLASNDGPLHPWLRDLPNAPSRPPTARIRELTTGLAGREPVFLGHDASDRWRAARKVREAAGLDEDWGTCPTCKGHAIHPDDIQLSEEWTPTEPPVGVGWQLWETTSEGSPASPVFATAEELAGWCAKNATTFADHTATREQWLEGFIQNTTEVDSLLVLTFPTEE